MEPIYLDHAATTPMRSEVREAMLPFLGERWGNPSSVHRWGRRARNAIEEARDRVAAALGAHRSEIVFTGGGTEADNLAILGCWRQARAEAGRAVVACSAIEHKAVLASVKAAEAEGADVVILGVDGAGRVPADTAAEAIAARPCVLSVMWGNNEIGTLQPIAWLARQCADSGVVFHTDAVQAFGKVRVRVDETPCALLSISSHKINGPQGVGALFVRDGVTLHPSLFGGGQERQLRPGTENVAGIVGFARAAELAAQEQDSEEQRVRALRDELQRRLVAAADDIIVHGGDAERLPHVLNIGVPHCDAAALLIGLDLEGVAVSGGSACQSGSAAPSHVLSAIGSSAEGMAAIRMSLGHGTTSAEIERAAQAFSKVVGRIRAVAAH
ncbi:MAG TPA: cysteine desulfurase family protein [Longimicrobiales bacterium]|nr:cysteine desulfurase family protein [Longimicrobiales bacterium]